MATPAERRPSGRAALLAVVTGAALGIVVFAAASAALRDFEPEAFGLGHGTHRVESRLDGRALSSLNAAATRAVMESFRAYRADGSAVALWLGASQLHAIHRYRPEHDLAVQYANTASREDDAPQVFLQASRGNASFRDLLGLYLAFRGRGLVPDQLIVALVYDDLRETGIRPDVASLLPELDTRDHPLGPEDRAVVAAVLRERDPGGGRADPVARSEIGGPKDDDSAQQRLERSLTGALAALSPSYAERGRVATWLELQGRLALRRGVLSARSHVRGAGLWRATDALPVGGAPREANEAALDALVSLARRDGAEVILYRQPHRPSAPPFYHDRADYDAFHAGVRARHARAGTFVLDLEQLVPTEAYGLNRELSPDVFHFSDLGHRLLGAAILGAVTGERSARTIGPGPRMARALP